MIFGFNSKQLYVSWWVPPWSAQSDQTLVVAAIKPSPLFLIWWSNKLDRQTIKRYDPGAGSGYSLTIPGFMIEHEAANKIKSVLDQEKEVVLKA